MKKSFWTPGRILALIIAGAAVIRMLATLTRQMVQFDETAYLRMAENLAAGNGLLDVSGLTSTHFAPLLPFFIAAVSFLVGDFVLSGYIVVTVFGCLLLIPVYLLGRALMGERVGLMAAALMAVTPIFVGTSEYIYSEGLYVFFLLMGVFFGWRMLNGSRPVCGALAGASLGLAYLANPSAIFYVIVLLALAVAVALMRKTWRRPAAPAGLMIALFFICSIPYIVFMHNETGRWTFSGKSTAGNIYAATHGIRREDIGTWEREILSLTENGNPLILELEKGSDNPLGFIIDSPVIAARNFVRETLSFYGGILSQVMPLWLLPLAGLGLFARGWDRARAAAIGYLVLMAAPMLLILAMYAHARFFMPFVPLATILVAAGWERLEEWGRHTAAASLSGAACGRWKRRAPWLVGAAVMLPVLVFAALTVKRIPYETQYKEAGLWLRQNAGEGQRVLNREFSSAYYAGGVAVILPYAGYTEMTDYARSREVHYLIVGRTAIEKYRPQLASLLEEQAAHPEWELVHVVRPGGPQETMIFEFVR